MVYNKKSTFKAEIFSCKLIRNYKYFRKRGNGMLKLFKKLKMFSLLVVGVLVFVLLQSLCELYIPTLMADIVDNGILNQDIAYVVSVGIKMLLFTLE